MSEVAVALAAALADRYRLERELGQGGMATVYLAHDLKHDRDVAIKVLSPDLGAALGAQRFLAEIRTTAKLQHPHILPLLDSGEAAGQLFYVMPYVAGETLHQRLVREPRLPVADAVRIATELAGALDHAHRHGIIHRDIKPENILLYEGAALLADFGIALAVRDAAGDRITGTGLSLGTPLYMSPEQAAGERTLDARSDVYALGAVTYEMLAGEPPITGATSQAIIAKVMSLAPTSLRVVRATIPASVDDAILRALAKAPVDRFASAGAFAAALASPVGAPTGRRSRQAAVGGSVVLLAVVAAAVVLRGRGAPTGTVQRLAVLPLASGRGSADSGLAAEGVTRSVIEALTEAGVPVVGHRAVVRYEGTALPLKEVAKELDVDAVVVGTVTQARDSVNVSLEMSDPATGQNRWAHTFHARSSDVLIMQREAAREIASAMHVTVSADRTARLAEDRQVNPEAYTHYLVGLRLIQRNTAETSRQAEVELRKSVALDSTYAPALAELANVFFFQAWFGTLGDSVARANSTGLMERAQAVDPDNPDMLVARGVYRSTAAWDFVGADADLKRAMALRPDAYTIDIYGWFLSVTLRSDPGIALVRRAVALEPRVSTYWNDYILVMMGSPDLAAARAVADSAIAIDPGFAAHYAPAAWIALAQGRVDAADSLMRRYDLLTSSAPDFWPSLLLAARGRSGEARRALATLEDQRAAAGKRRTESAFAAVYLTLGDTTTALRLMDEAVKRRDIDLLRTFYYPILREFARSPKMAGIRARMGLPH